jgi:hypothetical protein
MLKSANDNIAQLKKWLAEQSLLYVVIYQDGHAPDQYFVTKIEEIESLISLCVMSAWRSFEVTIFAQNPFRIQGIATEEFVKDALAKFPENRWVHIVSPEKTYPQTTDRWADDEHDCLLNDLHEYRGLFVGIGEEPFDYHDSFPPDEALTFSFIRPK